MPQLFRIGPYRIYFWANESDPLESIHVHITEGEPQRDATKVWITRNGHCILVHNKSKIPENILKRLMRTIEANSEDIKARWLDMFGEIRFFC